MEQSLSDKLFHEGHIKNREEKIQKLRYEIQILEKEKRQEERSKSHPGYIYTGSPIETEL